MLSKTKTFFNLYKQTDFKYTVYIPWIVLLGWMGVIFLFSHQPTLPGLPAGWADLIFKKLAHASAYAILMCLWWWALSSTAIARPYLLLLAAIFSVGYAVSDEWHQTFIPGRNGQPADVLIDTAGVLSAAIFLRWLRVKSALTRETTRGE